MEESRFAEETEKVFSEIIDEIEKYDWDFSYDYQKFWSSSIVVGNKARNIPFYFSEQKMAPYFK